MSVVISLFTKYPASTGCATTVLVTSAGLGEMVLQVVVGSVRRSLRNSFRHLYSCSYY